VSSLHAIWTGAPHVPVYTVSCVSKLVLKVLAVILPLVVGVKLYQTLRAFLSLVHECIGSDAAVVAVVVSTVFANGTALIAVGVAQSSFAGWACAPGVHTSVAKAMKASRHRSGIRVGSKDAGRLI